MKKRIVLIVLICIVGAGSAFAQDEPPFNISDMETAFSGFATGVAKALPMASTIGLQWSDAYIGNLPHLGIGAAVGFSSIPIATVTNTLSLLMGEEGGDFDPTEFLPAELKALPIGFPMPAAAADVRLGGLFLPFDIGFKIGFIPQQFDDDIRNALGGIGIDYLLWGFDIRYALVKEPKGFTLIPDLIVGGGYNYYRGGISMPMPGMEEGGFSIDELMVPQPNLTSFYNYSIAMDTPKIAFNWESHVIDVKAQVSKKILLLFTPYLGIGASYGRSRAGGIEAVTTVTRDGEKVDMQTLKNDIEAAEDAYEELKEQNEELKEYFGDEIDDSTETIDLTKIDIPVDSDGFIINQWVNGFSFRAFGGLSINIWVLKIDTSVMYDIIGQSLGAQVGVRLQF
jgi:hypothetical protein